MPIHAQNASRYYRGDSFSGRVALKLVVTTLVCVKLVINAWRFAPPEKSNLQEATGICRGRVRYTRSLKMVVFSVYNGDTRVRHRKQQKRRCLLLRAISLPKCYRCCRISLSYFCYPRKGEGICFHRRWFVCVSVCLSVTTISKKIVDGFLPNFMGRFLGGKRRPSSCFVTIGRGVWK